MAHGCRGTVAVVGHAFDHHRHTARAVAFIGQLDHIVGVGRTSTTGHGAVDDVAAHVGAQRLVQRQAQTRVGARVTATLTGSDGQFANPLGEDLAFLGILTLFAVLDVRPLGMASHNTTPNSLETLSIPPQARFPSFKRKGASEDAPF